MLVKLDKFIFFIDIVVMNIEEYREIALSTIQPVDNSKGHEVG